MSDLTSKQINPWKTLSLAAITWTIQRDWYVNAEYYWPILNRHRYIGIYVAPYVENLFFLPNIMRKKGCSGKMIYRFNSQYIYWMCLFPATIAYLCHECLITTSLVSLQKTCIYRPIYKNLNAPSLDAKIKYRSWLIPKVEINKGIWKICLRAPENLIM